MSETKPKRRFWRLHLSTAVLLMVVAGGLMWPNLKSEEMYVTQDRWIWTTHEQALYALAEANQPVTFVRWTYYGWPRRFCYRTDHVVPKQSGWDTTETLGLSFLPEIYKDPDDGELLLVVDVLVWLVLLVFFAIIPEWLIRRREARKA
jgi:hypothetical protein